LFRRSRQSVFRSETALAWPSRLYSSPGRHRFAMMYLSEAVAVLTFVCDCMDRKRAHHWSCVFRNLPVSTGRRTVPHRWLGRGVKVTRFDGGTGWLAGNGAVGSTCCSCVSISPLPFTTQPLFGRLGQTELGAGERAPALNAGRFRGRIALATGLSRISGLTQRSEVRLNPPQPGLGRLK
jgi:hypothetical protein